jgi:ribosome biogenesis GTPase A
MSKKDKRYNLAKRGMNEDETLLTVAEQFYRREGQAQISWYPGHIAKAEKRLQEVLSAVDVVVEVRDARIPTSTTHPSVEDWLRNRNIQRVVVINRMDQAPKSALSMWKAFLESQGTPVAFMNAKEGGRGLEDLKKAIKMKGKLLNNRRAERGMLPRNIRVAVMGYPNVGKSALLNRLAGTKKVKSENRAGVTRSLQWVRTDDYDLLDSPGIIPAKLLTQEIAVHLAICDDIGEASYDTILVAAALLDEVRKVGSSMPSYVDTGAFKTRYGQPLGTMSGEEYIWRLAQNAFMGGELNTAFRVLDDWRKGRLGLFTLEPPPSIPFHSGYYRALGLKKEGSDAKAIKTAYRSKARVLHPDFGGDRNEWQRVLKAYEVLSDPETRRLYDDHGLVWDIQLGQYRVLRAGEAVPTIKSLRRESGPLLLTGASKGSVVKMKKGMLTIPLRLSATGGRSQLLGGRVPSKPPPRSGPAP